MMLAKNELPLFERPAAATDAYVFKRKMHTLDCFNKSEALICRSSCHQSFTHFIFICLRTLLHKTVECGHGSYVKAKKMTF